MKLPKDYAEELVNKFRKEFDWVESQYAIDLYRDTRQCALIAVDEMIESYEFDVINDMTNQRYIDKLNYLDEVRQEINKL
jgi:predicted transcriptional regulator